MRPGRPYEIELLTPVNAPPGSPEHFAFFGDVWPEPTCGPGFPVVTGDRLSATFVVTGPGAGCASCTETPMVPSFESAGVTELRRLDGASISVGGWSPLGQAVVRVSEACTGEMKLSLNEPRSGLRESIGASAPSNYIFVRVFEASIDPFEVCVAPDIARQRARRCWDSWYVRITDDQGRVVTQHPDAGM